MTDLDLEDFTELQAGRREWNAGRVDSALAAFDLAIRRRPKNVRGLVEFARALGQQHEILRAEELLENALLLCRGHAAASIVVAQAFRSIFRQQRALELFTSLRQRGQMPTPILGELAVLFEQCGQWEEAFDAISECVSLAPHRNEPKLILARILRNQGKFDESERCLQRLIDVADAAPMLLVGCWSELCQIRDHRGEYDLAVTAIEKAKQILRELPGSRSLMAQSQRINQLFARLYSEIDSATIRRWHSKRFRPQHAEVGGIAHLIGFPRSGTTLLEQILDAHPAIVSAPERVVFSKLIFPQICQHNGRAMISAAALNSVPEEILHQQAARYLRLHQEIHGEPWNGRTHLDKNPNHMSLLAGLLRLSPESRFIVALRDPRDVIVSAYLRYLPISEFSVQFLDWESACQLYAREMQIWHRMREAMDGNWIEVRYEDTVADPRQQAERVIEFLGLDWSDHVMAFRERTAGKVINSPSQAEVRKPLYTRSIGRWQNYADHIAPYLELLPDL